MDPEEQAHFSDGRTRPNSMKPRNLRSCELSNSVPSAQPQNAFSSAAPGTPLGVCPASACACRALFAIND